MLLWLDKKYLNLLSSQLKNFKWKDKNKANHSCPICGDSQKSKTKARGNHYVDPKKGMLYKCFNCGLSTTTANLIKMVDPQLFKEYQVERFKEGDEGNSNYEKPTLTEKKKHPLDSTIVSDVYKNLIRLRDLPEEHVSIQYCKERKIPKSRYTNFFYTENINEIDRIVKGKKKKPGRPIKDPRLVLPYKDKKGNLVGISGRSLNEKSNLKYYTIKLREDTESLIFGIERVDFTKPVLVVEGPIDSLFLPNCVAVSGLNFNSIEEALPKGKVIVIVDKEPRNPQTVNVIQKIIKNGFRVCLLPESLPGKDINDFLKNGLTKKDLTNTIKNNTFKGLSAEHEFTRWKKIKKIGKF